MLLCPCSLIPRCYESADKKLLLPTKLVFSRAVRIRTVSVSSHENESNVREPAGGQQHIKSPGQRSVHCLNLARYFAVTKNIFLKVV